MRVMSNIKVYYRTVRDLPIEELLASGSNACVGCGPLLAARWVTKILGPNAIIVTATGCLYGVTAVYPYTSWKHPMIHVAFGNAPAVASGIETAIKVLKRKGEWEHGDTKVAVIAGDGATVDIGFGALSGMLERRHGVVYVLYDNEAYMSTGIQRSGSTPMYAWTTTTEVGSVRKGKPEFKKDVLAIVAAHRPVYAASTTVAHIIDLANKVRKAMEYSSMGPTFIHVLAPCPTGWKYDESLTIEVARLAVETGMWFNLEYENGTWKVTTKVPKRKPVKEYLKLQGRFAHLTDEDIKIIQEFVDENVKRINELVGEEAIGPVVT